MTTITDRFGRTVSKACADGETTYSVPDGQGGFFVITQAGDGDDQAALQTINSMSPPGAQVAAATIPSAVELWKAKAVLANGASKLHAGKSLLDDANAVIAAAPLTVQIAWANAAELQRDSSTLALLATEIGLGDADLDALFVAADAFTLP